MSWHNVSMSVGPQLELPRASATLTGTSRHPPAPGRPGWPAPAWGGCAAAAPQLRPLGGKSGREGRKDGLETGTGETDRSSPPTRAAGQPSVCFIHWWVAKRRQGQGIQNPEIQTPPAHVIPGRLQGRRQRVRHRGVARRHSTCGRYGEAAGNGDGHLGSGEAAGHGTGAGARREGGDLRS
jgi:hypothetical protein